MILLRNRFGELVRASRTIRCIKRIKEGLYRIYTINHRRMRDETRLSKAKRSVGED